MKSLALMLSEMGDYPRLLIRGVFESRANKFADGLGHGRNRGIHDERNVFWLEKPEVSLPRTRKSLKWGGVTGAVGPCAGG